MPTLLMKLLQDRSPTASVLFHSNIWTEALDLVQVYEVDSSISEPLTAHLYRT